MAENLVVKLKRTAVPNKYPVSLEPGEIVLNYHDGNLYYKHVSGDFAGIFRLDEIINKSPVVNALYDDNDDLIGTVHASGNRVQYLYNDRDLVSAKYYDVDGVTLLAEQRISYDTRGNPSGCDWVSL